MSTTIKSKIQAAVLSLAIMVPAGGAFAATRPHHYSQTRGAVVGALAGAAVGGTRGAIVGAGVGTAVQYGRNQNARSHSYRAYRHHHRSYYHRY